jgi:hypothetical protein
LINRRDEDSKIQRYYFQIQKVLKLHAKEFYVLKRTFRAVFYIYQRLYRVSSNFGGYFAIKDVMLIMLLNVKQKISKKNYTG